MTGITTTDGPKIPVLILSGSVGSGKTAVGYAAHELLSDRRVPHAFLDLDGLSCSWPPVGPFNEGLVLEGVGRLWPMYRAAGAERLLLARVIENKADLQAYAGAIADARVTLCRLTASEAVRRARLKARHGGRALKWHLARTVELEAVLERAALEDFHVDNERRSPEETALEVLMRAQWL